MAHKFRWRDGYVTTVMAPVEAATSIEIGDLVWLDVDRTYPAAEFVARYRRRNGRVHIPPLELMAAFAAKFLGVAQSASVRGSADPIRVGTTGVFDFDTPPTVPQLGLLAAPYLNPDGQSFRNQWVALTASPRRAIGRVVHASHTAVQTLTIAIQSGVLSPINRHED